MSCTFIRNNRYSFFAANILACYFTVAEDFTLKNQDDEEVHFYETLDKADKGVVIFVYPKANTAGVK